MGKDDARGRNGGLFSARSFTNYMRFVSSGASSAASSLRSASASLVSTIATNPNDDSTRDQVHWAGFDKLELDSNSLRQVLLLAYRSGFQVWDVERSDDVRQLASRHDGPISFLQVQKNPNPHSSTKTLDKFADSRPLLIVSFDSTSPSAPVTPINGGVHYDVTQDPSTEDGLTPSFVRFYSFKLQEYVHTLKFRSSVYSIRCSPRVVAISQASQIHCFNAASLEREYTILTNPISNVGYGPLAVGPRWLAYSGNPVAFCDAGRVTPVAMNGTNGTVHSIAGTGSLSNKNLLAHYAKESSRHVANGITALGDIGIDKLSKYYLRNSSNNNGFGSKKGTSDTSNGDNENAGTVIVRDVVSKQVVVQFEAHTSPISALCFDPSGTLLVTASVHGRNINVFRIMPPTNSDASGSGSYLHLYRLQRGLTNAVIKDISFSDDSEWIMISSSRGTSHLYAISPYCTTSYLNSNSSQTDKTNNDLILDNSNSLSHSSSPPLHQKSLSPPGPPVTLSVVSRIRNGSNGLTGLKGAAISLATSGTTNPISEAVASAFYKDNASNSAKDYLLVFSPMGSIVQYLLHRSKTNLNLNLNNSNEEENRFVVEALQKWDVCHKRNRRDNGEIFDIYGDQQQEAVNGVHVNMKKDFKIEESNKSLYYISQVELHTHIVEVPIWATSQMCFQVMSESEWEEDGEGGERKIECVPTRTIEARSKDLIPVFDSLHMIRFHHNNNRVNGNAQVRTALSEEGSHRSSCSSLDYNLSEINDSPSNGTVINGGVQYNVNNNNNGQSSQQVGVNRKIGGDHSSEARLRYGVNNNDGGVEASGLVPDLL